LNCYIAKDLRIGVIEEIGGIGGKKKGEEWDT